MSRREKIEAMLVDEPRDVFLRYSLAMELDKEGDWSTYAICFVETKDGRPTETPLASLDPRYACLDFTFKIDCPAEIDCATGGLCIPEHRPAPAISSRRRRRPRSSA